MEENSVYGLDIAKNAFHLCRMNRGGRVVERKRLQRSEVLEYFSVQAAGLIGIESCGGSSHWARELTALGYSVRLIPAQYVKPFVKSQKNDSIDGDLVSMTSRDRIGLKALNLTHECHLDSSNFRQRRFRFASFLPKEIGSVLRTRINSTTYKLQSLRGK